MSTSILDTAKSLPLSERIELAEALWESIIRDGYEPELTSAQAEELDRRLAAHEKNPDDAAGMMAGVKDADPKGKTPQKPLPVTILGRYAKVLLSSHEFLFVR